MVMNVDADFFGIYMSEIRKENKYVNEKIHPSDTKLKLKIYNTYKD